MGIIFNGCDMGTMEEAESALAEKARVYRDHRQPVVASAAQIKAHNAREHEARFQCANAALHWLWHREHALQAATAEDDGKICDAALRASSKYLYEIVPAGDDLAWLDEIEAWEAEAIPPPWNYRSRDGRVFIMAQNVRHVNVDGVGYHDVAYMAVTNGCDEREAFFIANARAAIPKLTAALRQALSRHKDATAGDDDEGDFVSCESCDNARVPHEDAISAGDGYLCPKCHAEWRKEFETCEHDWQPHHDEYRDECRICPKCSGIDYDTGTKPPNTAGDDNQQGEKT